MIDENIIIIIKAIKNLILKLKGLSLLCIFPTIFIINTNWYIKLYQDGLDVKPKVTLL